MRVPAWVRRLLRLPDPPPQRWQVQAFLLARITGDQDRPYAPTVCTSEREANELVKALHCSHGPDMIRVEKHLLPAPTQEQP